MHVFRNVSRPFFACSAIRFTSLVRFVHWPIGRGVIIGMTDIGNNFLKSDDEDDTASGAYAKISINPNGTPSSDSVHTEAEHVKTTVGVKTSVGVKISGVDSVSASLSS